MSISISRSERVPARSRREFEEQLLEWASEEAEFIEELIENPQLALAKELGIAIPDGVTVRVVEQTPSTFYIVLPPVASNDLETNSTTGVVRLLEGSVGPMY
jgi:hypothetical protein